jgi:hypothetical protein
MKTSYFKATIVMLFILSTTVLFAQPPGGGGGSGGGGTPPGGTGAPVDDGAIGLLIALATYAYFKFKEKKPEDHQVNA